MIKIAKVIPLVSSIQKDHLTYFTAREINAGDIVTVPIRSKSVDAMVIEVGEAIEDKTTLKEATFGLKKITSVKGGAPFRKTFIRACREASHYQAGMLGAVLDTMLPSLLFKNFGKLKETKQEEPGTRIMPEKLAFQSTYEDRVAFYKTFIRESFAKKESVFICVPTIQEIRKLKEELKKGIEQHTFVFHSDMSNKQFVSAYNSCLAEEHQVLIVATAPFLFIPRNDIATYIVEHESSVAYRVPSRPYVDMRIFAELFAYENKSKIILADSLLRMETLYRKDAGDLQEVSPVSYRIPQNIKEEIASMKRENKDGKSAVFSVFTKEVKDALEFSNSTGGRTFLFALRKGLAPITVCQDCGTTVLCKRCDSPLVLYKTNSEENRIYVCNKCKYEDSTDITCRHCGSWNLIPLGIGTTLVRDEVLALYKDRPVIVFDKDTIKSEKEAMEALSEFYSTPKAVLVGTELALYYMEEKVETAAIISFDSLFSLPTFRINERIVHILEALRDLADKQFIIQTKNPDEKILLAFKNSTLLGFYRDEIAERKMLSYPPFSVLIKISYQGTYENSEKAKSYLQETFKDYKPDIMDAFIKRIKGMYIMHALIRIPSKNWTRQGLSMDGSFDHKLENLLKSLPPSFKVQVDPENIL